MRTDRSSGLDPSLEAAHRRAGELGGVIPSPGGPECGRLASCVDRRLVQRPGLIASET